MTENALSHDELALDLAAHLSSYSTPMVVWTDMQLGPSGSARPDVYTIEKTYTALRARAFEIKISRSDFLSDVTSGKYLKYGEFAGSITFATPAGLVSKDEVPKGCGLITRSPEGTWRYQKKPTLQATPPLSQQAWLKLVIDGIKRERSYLIAEKCAPKHASTWLQQDRMRKIAGEELGRALANRDRALAALNEETDRHTKTLKDRQEQQQAEVRKERAELEKIIADAERALGMDQSDHCGRGIWAIRMELDARIKGGTEQRLRDALRAMDHSISNMQREREDLARLLPLNEKEPE